MPLPPEEPIAWPDAPAADGTEAVSVSALRPVRVHLVWWLSLAVVALDQISKAIVFASVALYESLPVIPGFIDLVHVRNEGVAFGLLNEADLPYKAGVTGALALVALAGIVFYARHLRAGERLARIGLSLIFGGAVGNLIDRVRVGYVVDFVDVYWADWHFWAFNAADAAITIGAILVFVDLLVVTRHASDPV